MAARTASERLQWCLEYHMQGPFSQKQDWKQVCILVGDSLGVSGPCTITKDWLPVRVLEVQPTFSFLCSAFLPADDLITDAVHGPVFQHSNVDRHS